MHYIQQVLKFINIFIIINLLFFLVLYDLFAKLKELHKDEKVKAIVITGANGLFSAGFDIMEFKNKEAQMDGSFIIEEFCHNLEEGRVPTVAAIDGLALGYVFNDYLK